MGKKALSELNEIFIAPVSRQLWWNEQAGYLKSHTNLANPNKNSICPGLTSYKRTYGYLIDHIFFWDAKNNNNKKVLAR